MEKNSNSNWKPLSLPELHDIYYHALFYFDSFCHKNGLQYFAFYGTLLGAIRERQIIKWDDDVDVVMFRADFEKLISLIPQFENGFYSINHYSKSKHFYPSFVRIMISGTLEKSSHDFLGMDHRCYIDVFPLDNAPEDGHAECAQKNLHRFYLTLIRKFPNYSSPNWRVSLLRFVRSLMLAFLPEKRLHQKMDVVAQQFNNQESHFLFSPFVDCLYPSGVFHIFNKNYFSSVVRVPFGPIFVDCPSGFNQILPLLYGETYLTPIDKYSGKLPFAYFADEAIIKSSV